jgi:hypothetical protein
MPDDPLSALEEIRERSERPLGPSAMALPISSPAVRGLLESAGDVPRLLAVVDAVLKLHRQHRLYDECGHEHSEDEVRAGLAADAGEFLACEDGFERKVCRHCCANDGNGQIEDCAVTHLADECWPCSTVQAITRELTTDAISGG